MGTSPLGLKLTRRIARDVGAPIKRGVGSGGYHFGFVTFDHRHGVWSKRDGTVGWLDDDEPLLHWSSCRYNFGEEPAPRHVCGYRETIDDGESTALDVVCDEPADHGPARHRCGSVTWTALTTGPRP